MFIFLLYKKNLDKA